MGSLQNVPVWATISGPFSQKFFGAPQTFAWFAPLDGAPLVVRAPQLKFIWWERQFTEEGRMCGCERLLVVVTFTKCWLYLTCEFMSLSLWARRRHKGRTVDSLVDESWHWCFVVLFSYCHESGKKQSHIFHELFHVLRTLRESEGTTVYSWYNVSDNRIFLANCCEE